MHTEYQQQQPLFRSSTPRHLSPPIASISTFFPSPFLLRQAYKPQSQYSAVSTIPEDGRSPGLLLDASFFSCDFTAYFATFPRALPGHVSSARLLMFTYHVTRHGRRHTASRRHATVANIAFTFRCRILPNMRYGYVTASLLFTA